MPISEAKKRANKKWNDAHMKERYDRFQIVLPVGRKSAVEAFARDRGLSVNGLVNSLLQHEMGLSDDEWKSKPSDSVSDASETAQEGL